MHVETPPNEIPKFAGARKVCVKSQCDVLGDILQASDHLSHVINSYERIVEGKMETAPQERAPARKGSVSLSSCVFVWEQEHPNDVGMALDESDAGSVFLGTFVC